MINMLAVIAAVRNLTILVPTAVPMILEASLAPKDHPKNKPELRNMKKLISISDIPFDCKDQKTINEVFRSVGNITDIVYKTAKLQFVGKRQIRIKNGFA